MKKRVSPPVLIKVSSVVLPVSYCRTLGCCSLLRRPLVPTSLLLFLWNFQNFWNTFEDLYGVVKFHHIYFESYLLHIVKADPQLST